MVHLLRHPAVLGPNLVNLPVVLVPSLAMAVVMVMVTNHRAKNMPHPLTPKADATITKTFSWLPRNSSVAVGRYCTLYAPSVWKISLTMMTMTSQSVPLAHAEVHEVPLVVLLFVVTHMVNTIRTDAVNYILTSKLPNGLCLDVDGRSFVYAPRVREDRSMKMIIR